MAKKKDKNSNRHIWNKAFIELALRAMRKLHIKYGVWGVGQSVESKMDFKKLNQGPGIEIAEEKEVCAAISQEFISSRFTNGVNLNGEARYYELNREVHFKNADGSSEFLDLFIDRFKPDQNRFYRYPVFIEAKRYRRYKPNIVTGKISKPDDNFDDIKADIKFLESKKVSNDYRLPKSKYDGELRGSFTYVLLWDKIDIKKYKKGKLIEDIKTNIGLSTSNDSIEIGWLPLTWTDDLKIENWLWVALIEINPYSKKDNPDEKVDENWFTPKSV
jgi:hypothetical protein